MNRFSLSLGEEQDEWIAERSDELGISKGKVVRECIDAVRTGESLFTDTMKTGEPADSDRVSEVEERLEELEEMVRDISQRARREETAPVPNHEQHPSTSEPQSPPASASDVGQSPSGEPPADQSTDSPPDDQSPPAHPTASHSHDTSDDPERPSSGSSTASNADPHRTGPRMPGSVDDPAPESTDETANEEFDTPDVDTSDPEEVRMALGSALPSDAHASAVFSCWQEVQERGTVHVRTLKAHFDEYPLDHDDQESWWDDTIRPVLTTLPGIDPPPGDGNFYRFKY